jgi:hypothetical protein
MRILNMQVSKNAIFVAAGAVLLGTSVALSSAGAVFGANAQPAGYSSGPFSKKNCNTGGYCLTEANKGSGGGISVSNNSSTDAAIGATNNNSTAIYADSYNGAAVIGLGRSQEGVIAQSNGTSENSAALESQGSASGTNLFYAYNNANESDCLIDAFADLSCSGIIGQVQRNTNGQRVVAYTSESASATIEDVGTARMYGGVANVQLDPAFASVIDHKWYYVFLTPLGDTRGLYVSVKTASGFQARETERGRGSLEFDYRIVAHPLGARYARLPAARTIVRR